MFEFNLSTDPRGRIFLDPVAFADMDHWHEVARELRNDAPILRVEAEGYEAFTALTRHAEVFEVSRRSDIWHNTQRSMLMPDWLWMFILSLGIDPKTLIHMDGVEHRDHRQVANDWFKPAAVRHRQADIEAIADQFVQRMVDLDGECDFAQDIAVPYTLRVIMSIFGIPEEDEPLMLRLTQGIFGANEGSAIGVLNGAKEMKRKIVIIGYDSGKQQKAAIASGEMAGAITQNPVGIGFKTVEAAVKALKGEKLPKIIDTGFYWYDKSNLADPKIAAVLYD